MGIYFRSPQLEADEQINFNATSKRVWTGRSVAGKLVVTDRRVLYTPTWLDTMVGARPWALKADDIEDVQVEAGGPGGARKRGPAGWHETTRIDGKGSSAYFAVNDGDQLRAALSHLRAS